MQKQIILVGLVFLLTGNSAFGQFKNQHTVKTFLQKNQQPEVNSFFDLVLRADTTIRVDSSISIKHSIGAVTVLKQVGLGTVWGVLCTVPGAFIAEGISGGKGTGGFGVGVAGAYTGFVFGTSLGVYLGVVEEKPNASFWRTLGSGVLGSALGFGVHILSDHNKITGILPALLPIIFPIIYVDLFD